MYSNNFPKKKKEKETRAQPLHDFFYPISSLVNHHSFWFWRLYCLIATITTGIVIFLGGYNFRPEIT
jgi:hypothetical protein